MVCREILQQPLADMGRIETHAINFVATRMECRENLQRGNGAFLRTLVALCFETKENVEPVDS